MRHPIDFDGIKAVALRNARWLLPELIPDGRFEHDEYVALNPSRADKNLGSFKINSRTGQWSDFATGAKGGDIISWNAHAYGLDQGEAARRIAQKLQMSAHKDARGAVCEQSRLVCSYDYPDENGKLLHQTVRYTPKEFLQRRPDLDDPAKWIWNLKGVRTVLFRLPEVLQAVKDGKPVYVVEGERDALALRALGLTATCNPMGAGKWRDEYSDFLRDGDVILVEDNDDPGRKHVEHVARSLSGVAKRVRALDISKFWPECPEHGDISNWLKEGRGTVEKLNEIVDALPDWQPMPESTDEPTNTDDTSPSWECPDLSLLDDRRGELPPFPLDVLSPSWQEWATNAAHGAGTAVDHVVVPLLGIASSLIGIARRVRASKSWPEPFTMWTAIVGYSGTGKTPGLDVTQRALARVEGNRKHLIGELRRAHESKLESAKAANKQWKAKVKEAIEAGRKGPEMPADAEIPEAFVAPRMLVSDSTIEKLAVLLQARPHGMSVIRDELAGLFLNLSRYSGGTDKEFWLEAWNGKPYKVERMNRPPVDVEHLLVGVTGGFQPDKLARSFDGDADGLYARVLFAWPAEAPYRPLTDTIEEVEPEFENALSRLIDLPEFAEGKLITRDARLTPDAVTVFEQYRQLVHQKKGGLDGREREWWVKTPAHVLRLAGTLTYLDWAREKAGTAMPEPNRIEPRFVAATVRLVTEYFWPHARAALRQLGLTEPHTNARRVLRWLQAERGPGSEVSLQDIRRNALGQSLDAEATTKLIDTLVRAGWLRQAPTVKTGGHPLYHWLINPHLWAAESAGSAESPRDGSEQALSALSALSAPTQENTRNSEEETAWTL
jgi:5S rRNA maturation endonuclease (ribonuclease M5)